MKTFNFCLFLFYVYFLFKRNARLGEIITDMKNLTMKRMRLTATKELRHTIEFYYEMLLIIIYTCKNCCII